MTSEVSARARVVHHAPGRMRLRFEKGADVPEAARRLEAACGEVPGVRAIELRPAARSIILRYNPAELEPQRLLDEVHLTASVKLVEEGAHLQAREPDGTAVGQSVLGAFGVANTRVRKVTRGIVDLRDAFPLALLGLGIRRVIQGNLEAVPWYVLLFYGYATFSDLHGRRRSPVEPAAAEIVRRRYARGELSRDEFREMLSELGKAQPPDDAR